MTLQTTASQEGMKHQMRGATHNSPRALNKILHYFTNFFKHEKHLFISFEMC
jgi:hypothetical protein